jgi:hypothetical protein
MIKFYSQLLTRNISEEQKGRGEKFGGRGQKISGVEGSQPVCKILGNEPYHERRRNEDG